MRWESIWKKITRKIIDYFLVGCRARGLQKGGFGCVLAIKAKKGKKKRQAVRVSLRREGKNHYSEVMGIGNSCYGSEVGGDGNS